MAATAEALRSLTAALAANYGTPNLGNKSDPVDELVYIILSRRTREEAYQTAFETLKDRYQIWEEALAAPLPEIASAVRRSGLGQKKATSIRGALAGLHTEFGACTLAPTSAWSDEEVLEFLCTLPEIGPKSAACVMMCSLDRPAFPVDAHVGRVLARLGIFERFGIHLLDQNHKVRQAQLWDLVPPSLRYALHVNAVMHGRAVCLAERPRCSSCLLAEICRHPAAALPSDRSPH